MDLHLLVIYKKLFTLHLLDCPSSGIKENVDTVVLLKDPSHQRTPLAYYQTTFQMHRDSSMVLISPPPPRP